MTPTELVRELRAARPVAGEALRERVRTIAAGERLGRAVPLTSWRPRWRLALVAVPAAAAAAVAVAVVAGVTRTGTDRAAAPPAPRIELMPAAPATASPGTVQAGTDRTGTGQAGPTMLAPSAKAGAAVPDATAPVPTPGRAQRYAAQLSLAVKDGEALSQATQSALSTARRLGGHVVSVQYASADTGAASLVLQVPIARVQDALVSLTALGRIVEQQVQIDDLQAQVDELRSRESALRERIARLSARLAAPGLGSEARAALAAQRDTARGELARARSQSAQVLGESRFATIQLALRTERSSSATPAPSRLERTLDEAGRILAWEAAFVVYALVVAGPLALLALGALLARRLARRRQDERLLAAP